MSESPPRCPQCNARMSPSPDKHRWWCQFCGSTRDDPDALQKLEAYLAHERTPYEPPTRDIDMDPIKQRILNEAWDSIQDNDLKTAAYILNGAVKQDPNFADAWYLLSKTTSNPGEQKLYLAQALSAQPYHEYAWHDKGVLEGVIPSGEGHAADTPDPEAPVEAKSETEACPSCGGKLALDAALGVLVCQHCGFRPGDAPRRLYRGRYDKLDNALLKRRFGFSKEWHIGERILVCQNCHAQLTLPGTELSAQCRFCDTAHVLVQDAVGSFEEPDGLLPFKIDRRAAAQAVHNRLAPDLRSQVERGDLQGVYLPFWAFEAASLVLESFMPTLQRIRDVLVSGVSQPGQAVLTELMPFDLHDLVSYDHRYLSQWPAQLYSIDVIEASITGWAYIKYATWRQTCGEEFGEVEMARSDADYHPPDELHEEIDRAKVKELNYRLLLLPFWMVTLYFSDGSHRPAVVNGQTGEAVISASFVRPDTLIAKPKRPPKELPVIQPLPGHHAHHNVIRPIAPPPRRIPG